MLNYPLSGMLAPTIDQLPKKKRSWQASLFDKLNPESGLGLSDEDKSKLGRQGLLQLGLGLLTNGGGFGNALGEGIKGGLLAMNQGQDDIVNRQFKKQMLANQSNGGADFQSKHMMAQAAGLKPGTPEYQNFMLVQGGILGRASNAGFGFEEVEGADGRKRLQRRNPRTGAVEVLNEETGQLEPLLNATQPNTPMPGGGGMPGNDPLSMQGAYHNAIASVESNNDPSAVSPKGALGTMQTMPGTLVSPGFGVMPARNDSDKERTRVGRDYANAMMAKYGPIGGLAAYNWGPGNWEAALQQAGGDPQRALSLAPAETQAYVPKVLAQVNRAKLATSRSKEEEAAAVAAAEESTKLGFMPQRNALEAQGAGMTTTAQEDAKLGAFERGTPAVVDRAAQEEAARKAAAAKAEADAKLAAKQLSSTDTLSLLDQAEALVPTSTGSGIGAGVDKAGAFVGKSNRGADAIASLKAISGQLVAKMPRMEGPQSDRDVQMYKDMAGNLADPMTPRSQRLSAIRTIRALNEKYAKPQDTDDDDLINKWLQP